MTKLHHLGSHTLTLAPLQNEFHNIDLGDRRLNDRSCFLIDKLEKSPKSSINAALSTLALTLAAYRFFANPKVTPHRMLTPHRQQSINRVSGLKSIRLVQDTSEADFSNLKTLKGVGPLATKEKRGMFLHTSLIVAPGGLALGVRDIDFLIRKDEDLGKSAKRKNLPIEQKESFRWLKGYRDACQLQEEIPETEVVSVSDREADMYEIFSEYEQRKKEGLTTAHYVIRAKENRVLLGEHEGLKLFDLDSVGEPIGEITFEVEAQKQRIKVNKNSKVYQRKKRMVTQEIRVQKITPRPPQRKGQKMKAVSLWLVSATEINVPEGQRPIHWRLLTSKSLENSEQAKEILEIYLDRWQIEVFFKTLKTGCKIEELALKSSEALKNAIVMYSLIAWRQLYITRLARSRADEPVGKFFQKYEWQSTLKVFNNANIIEREPTLGEFILIVAKLGGYLNRKHDPDPGIETLWRGFQKVDAYAEAWLAFARE